MSKKYQPSNGTEGIGFIDKWCCNCIHGKYEHTGNIHDKPCEILSATMLFNVNERDYPEEWIYDEKDKPICTAWRKWDWGRDDDGNFLNPEPPPTPDPRQLCMPFIFDELEIPKIKTQTA